MDTESKKEYVEKWQSYIKEIGTLCFTSDEALSKKIRDLVEELAGLVPQVADTKKFKGE